MGALIAIVALVGFVVACASPTPTPSPSPVPTVPSTPPLTPVPAADLVVAGTVRGSCLSFGGCAYFINLDGDGGSWKAEFGQDAPGNQLAGAEGLPATIPAGTYTLTLSSVMVSDLVLNGERQFGPTDATCATTLDVRGDQPIRIQGTFDKGSCEVQVNA